MLIFHYSLAKWFGLTRGGPGCFWG